jgi:iron(III) transport system substrate-binding protein
MGRVPHAEHVCAAPAPTRRAVIAGAASLALTTGAAGQVSAGWEAVIAAAPVEGRINLYHSAPPEQAERLIEAFRKRHPAIRIVQTRGAGDLPPRVAAERQSGADGADVFLFSDPLWYNVNAEHVLPLRSPSIDRLEAKHWQLPGKAPIVAYPPFSMLVWNTRFVPNGLRTYEDILDPGLRGRIGTREDMTAVVAGYLDFLERQFGADYLRRLATQKPKFYPSIVPMVQAVASGEIWAANLSVPSAVRDLQKQGAPIAAVVPKPTYGIVWAAGALATSRRQNAARLFMDFVMTPEGQLALNGDGDGASPLGVPGTLDMSDYVVFEAARFDQQAREDWRRKFNQLFRGG